MVYTIPKYRVLWTWDYCTFWDQSYFWRGKGACGANQRRAYFLEDYKRMVDYSASHGINGIVIWGALRAHNGGEGQLKELIHCAAGKGVRILPGCGVFGYGGIYYDPRKSYNGWDSPMEPHPYALHTWLKKHPEYAAVAADGKPYNKGPYGVVACPSKKENIEWFKEALAWLFEEFNADGVQIEVGDYAVCYCDDCRKRRSNADIGHFSIEDMLKPYTAAVETARKIKPDAWVICETYSSFAKTALKEKAGFGAALEDRQKEMLAGLPDGAIAQWVLDRAVSRNPTHIWEPDAYVPTGNNIARIHAGSQWAGSIAASQRASVIGDQLPANLSGAGSRWVGTDEWAADIIGRLVRKARVSGINGVSIFGEESPASPPNEANYLVFSEFCGFGKANPDCDIGLFYSQTLDPLYGGSDMAKAWEDIYRKGNMTFDSQGTDDKKQLALQLAQEAHSISSKLSGEACRRWAWLENWLWRAEFIHKTSIKG